MVDIILERDFNVFPPVSEELIKIINGLIKSLEQRNDLK